MQDPNFVYNLMMQQKLLEMPNPQLNYYYSGNNEMPRGFHEINDFIDVNEQFINPDNMNYNINHNMNQLTNNINNYKNFNSKNHRIELNSPSNQYNFKPPMSLANKEYKN